MSVIPELRAGMAGVAPFQRAFDFTRFAPRSFPGQADQRLLELSVAIDKHETNLRFNKGLEGYLVYRGECKNLSDEESICLAKLNLTQAERYLMNVVSLTDITPEYVEGACINGLGHATVVLDLLSRIVDKHCVVDQKKLKKDALLKAIEDVLLPVKLIIRRSIDQYQLREMGLRRDLSPGEPFPMKKEFDDLAETLVRNSTVLNVSIEGDRNKDVELRINVEELFRKGALQGLNWIELVKLATICQALSTLSLYQLTLKDFPIPDTNIARKSLTSLVETQGLLFLAQEKLRV